MPKLSTSAKPDSRPHAIPTAAEVLNAYFYKKALVLALNATNGVQGGSILPSEFEKDTRIPFATVLAALKSSEMSSVLSSDSKGINVMLPYDVLNELQTSEGLLKAIAMSSVLSYEAGSDLRNALKAHSTRFPDLYSAEMIQAIESKKAA